MNWLLIAFGAQFILATSSIFDKLLLKKKVFDPLAYTFWWGVLGMAAIAFVPFGFTALPAVPLLFAIGSGVVFFFAMLALFTALTHGKASGVLPLIAALSPLFTMAVSFVFLPHAAFTGADAASVAILVFGAMFFFVAEEKEVRFRVVALTALSALFFSVSYVWAKFAFDAGPFVSGFVWSKVGSTAAAAAMLLFPSLRRSIFSSSKQVGSANTVWYLANRAYAAAGSVFVSLAVSLAHPALVDATQAMRYIVIFLGSFFILREHETRREFVWKLCGTVVIAVGLVWLGLVAYARSIPVDQHRHIEWGVTFSSKYAAQLGVDPHAALDAIMSDINPRKLRLVAYWDEIERTRGQYDFSDLDWQLEHARRDGTEIILALGLKVPRWPECFVPKWAADLEVEEREDALRVYMKALVERYKNDEHIKVWQVENEPFLRFGMCIERGADFLEKEVLAVRSVDTKRPVLTTDSGEFGTWLRAASFGDMFGTTMYRKVYPPSIGHITGAIEYPIGPSFFRAKEKIARLITRNYTKSYIVIELQAEPWGVYELPKLPYEEHIRLFPVSYFREVIQYARDTGFSEYYLWGAEWWYFAKEKHDNSAYWDEAKMLIQNSK